MDDIEEYEFDEGESVYMQAITAIGDEETFCCILPCIDTDGDESLAVVWQAIASHYEIGDRELLFVPDENEAFFDANPFVRIRMILNKTMAMRKALIEKGYKFE